MPDISTAEDLAGDLAVEIQAAADRGDHELVTVLRAELLVVTAGARRQPVVAAVLAAPSTPFPKPVNATALDLLQEIKGMEDSADGSWNGGDIVALLCEWFEKLGIDPDAPASAYVAAPGDVEAAAWALYVTGCEAQHIPPYPGWGYVVPGARDRLMVRAAAIVAAYHGTGTGE